MEGNGIGKLRRHILSEKPPNFSSPQSMFFLSPHNHSSGKLLWQDRVVSSPFLFLGGGLTNEKGLLSVMQLGMMEIVTKFIAHTRTLLRMNGRY